MTSPLTLETSRQQDGTPFVTATGEIDLSNVTGFTWALADATAAGAVTIDLRGVGYIDSAAINALFTHADGVSRVLAHPLLMPVLTVSGLTGLIDVER
ncbi:STAS domain-containing protein [Amycolatopsis sp. FDAARGOS 1241]|uniref:STAS domain-containing protein n=1 Tax=Amycolatopsis sp. FDAARGOS 1241 TaxID=2778070 RepID=UPI00195066EE|nr:STAS domain-containing protein [Amycolatopsis sp. FDAARGOS 1241]QRP50163.1 STAS domain-containing protein [Amycolatopsis sp. FDAARGOS 1241]